MSDFEDFAREQGIPLRGIRTAADVPLSPLDEASPLTPVLVGAIKDSATTMARIFLSINAHPDVIRGMIAGTFKLFAKLPEYAALPEESVLSIAQRAVDEEIARRDASA